MATSRTSAVLTAVAMVLGVSANAQTRNEDASSLASTAKVLALYFSNNRQSVAATVGEQIELTLGMIGPRHFGDLQISSPAIRLESTAMDEPPNPGGPRYIYIFKAVTVGEAQVTVPELDAITGQTHTFFSMTIRVGQGARNPPLHANLRSDQANTNPSEGLWASAATSSNKSFLPILRESFVPSLPDLTAVEVELLAVLPVNAATGNIEMWISDDARKMMIADVSKTVSNSDCSHVLFLLPRGGIHVTPGHVYIIHLIGVDGVFGWKYVVGGYREGSASAPYGSIPPLPDTRSTFLFHTFGKN